MRDLIAGVVVAIVALPLALAFAIGLGCSAGSAGLYTRHRRISHLHARRPAASDRLDGAFLSSLTASVAKYATTDL